MSAATAKPKPPPYVKRLIPEPLVYRRVFVSKRGVKCMAEFHADKLVLHVYGGRRRTEFKFEDLWAVFDGALL